MVWEHRSWNKQVEHLARGRENSITIANGNHVSHRILELWKWATKSISVIIAVVRNGDTKASSSDTVVTRQLWDIAARGIRMDGLSSGRSRKLSGWRSSSGSLALVHISGISITIDAVVGTAVPGVPSVGHETLDEEHGFRADKKSLPSRSRKDAFTVEINGLLKMAIEMQSGWKRRVGNREL